MPVDIRAALRDSVKAQAFAEHIADGYLTPAFGARSKSEIDLLVFTALVKAGAVDPRPPFYELARALNVTPARVRTLVFNWQLRDPSLMNDLSASLREALQLTRFSKDGTLLTFGIESPLLKEEVIARLKAKGVFADASFAKEIVRMPVDVFVEFLAELVEHDTKKEFVDRLTKDKQLKNKSFKAIASEVFSKLGEKIVGETLTEVAAELVGTATPVAKELSSFLYGLLKSRGKDAADAVAQILNPGK
jgi:hypothetical protein